MAEKALTDFELETTVGIRFDAQDLVDRLTPMQLIELVSELDGLMGWEFTELLARRIERVADEAPEEISNLTEEQLINELSFDPNALGGGT